MSEGLQRVMRCDLHVHTVHSGMCTVPGLTRVCRESYNEPHALYERLKQRGMDLVTVTDHDSIDAVEELRRYPDFFLSEEVTCTMPSGTEMHAGVYGIEEHDHIELQRRRHDIESLLAYALERRLFVTVNHLYSSLTGPRKEDDFAVFARDFHGVETVNGQMLARSNKLAREFARRYSKPVVGRKRFAHPGRTCAHIYRSSWRIECSGIPGRYAARPEYCHGRIGGLFQIDFGCFPDRRIADRREALDRSRLRSVRACARHHRRELPS